MLYNIIDLIESDETMSTCQMFNAEVCYGGLIYDTEQATAQIQAQVEDFTTDNDLSNYFLGVCQDFKHFAFAVSVISILFLVLLSLNCLLGMRLGMLSLYSCNL